MSVSIVSDWCSFVQNSPDSKFYKVPLFMLQDGIGPEVLTFSALCSLPEVQERGMTYRGVQPDPLKPENSITERSGLPYSTVRRHLQKLSDAGLISKLGRQHRRTNTIVVDADVLRAYKSHDWPFVPIMDWAKPYNLSCSEHLVLADIVRASRFGKLPSQSDISRRLHLDREAVRHALRHLTSIASIGLMTQREAG